MSLELIKDLGTQYPTETSNRKRRFALYKCKCGVEFKAQTEHVNTGRTTSCGCYKKAQNTTHGLSGHKLYRVWASMISRVTNPLDPYFKEYGGRNISICDEWKNDFKTFYDWCIVNGWTKGLEIDRKNNDKNYEPSNCRFVTKSINQRNKRKLQSNNTSGFRGVSWHKAMMKWEAKIGINGKQQN